MTELESDTLAGLWSLQRLDLDRNLISELHKHSFRNLTIRPNGESCWVLVRGCGRGQLFYATVGGCGSTVQFLNDRAFDRLHNLLGLSLVQGFGVRDAEEDSYSTLQWGVPDAPAVFRNLIELRSLQIAHNRIQVSHSVNSFYSRDVMLARVLAMTPCPSVCLSVSVCHKSEFYRNG